MKKYVTIWMIAVMILSAAISLNAQDKKNQFSIGYGVITVDEELDLIEGVLGDVISLGSYTFDNEKMSGAVILTYNNAISKVVHIGGAVAYEQITKDVVVAGDKKGELKRNFITLGIESKFAWLNRDFVQMYSSAGIGLTINKDEFTETNGNSNDDSQTHFNFQLSALGLRIGNTLAGYAEVGYGYKGILNFGLSVRF